MSRIGGHDVVIGASIGGILPVLGDLTAEQLACTNSRSSVKTQQTIYKASLHIVLLISRRKQR